MIKSSSSLRPKRELKPVIDIYAEFTKVPPKIVNPIVLKAVKTSIKKEIKKVLVVKSKSNIKKIDKNKKLKLSTKVVKSKSSKGNISKNSKKISNKNDNKGIKLTKEALLKASKAKEKKVIDPETAERMRIKAMRIKDSWEGNSDSDGSVESAALDEDICYACGKNTNCEENWKNLIICDSCEGEFHLQCVKLDKLPRHGWKCPRCLSDEYAFEKLKFNVDDEKFKIPKRKKSQPPIELCYSPSRPLEEAWEECKRKGFMVVSNVFSYDVMKKLTHGVLTKKTASGRIAETWKGATREIVERLNSDCKNIINRGGRYDMRLPSYIVEELKLDLLLEPILEKLKTIMGTPTPILRTHDIIFAPVGSESQAWHTDDTLREGKVHRYFTILIHLNPIDSECGGTEIWLRGDKCGDMVRGRPGDAFIFNGSLMHRGFGNFGNSHRFFYYASFACRSDTNTEP